MGFAVLADLRVKLKGDEKKDKYLNLAMELKKMLNMKVKIPVIIGALGNVTKWLVQGLEVLGIRGLLSQLAYTGEKKLKKE